MSDSNQERTYEMLWDCPHCGTRKNLGLSHRHCPNCGAEQNSGLRYFPTDEEKVAVQDHAYAGADLKCKYCGALNGRRCHNCANCGASLEGTADVSVRQDQVSVGGFSSETEQDARREFAQPKLANGSQASKRRGPAWAVPVVALLSLLGVGLIVGVFFVKRDAEVTVADLTWKREITVERLGPVAHADWCSNMPARANVVRRSREVRSQRDVPDGEDCKTRRVDRGDGTFVEKRECTTRYRKEPIYDDKCSYTLVEWAKARGEVASGTMPGAEPSWPPVQLQRVGDCLGCEREGARTEEYTVQLTVGKEASKASCKFDQSRWATYQPGQQLRGKVSAIGGLVDCSALTFQSSPQ